MKKRLFELADVIRSKNSGPFELTLDILFADRNVYETVKKRAVLTRERVALLYRLPVESVHPVVFYDQAMGCKITFDRSTSSGSSEDRDVYGAQQHMPLGNLEVEL